MSKFKVIDGKAVFVDSEGTEYLYSERMHGPEYKAAFTRGLKPLPVEGVEFDEATKKKSKKPSPTTKRKTKESANPAIDE